MDKHIFRRGNLYLRRNIGRALILFCIAFLLGNVFSASLALHLASSRAEEALLAKFKIVACVVSDFDASAYEDDDFPSLDEETYLAIGSLPEVLFYDYSTSLYLPTEERALFIGTEHFEPLDLYLGVIEIIHGRTFTEAEINEGRPCAIVSETFAARNLLTVGSTASLTYDIADLPQYDKSYKDPNLHTFTFAVIGIFQQFGREMDVYMPNDSLTDERNHIEKEFYQSWGVENESKPFKEFHYVLNGPRDIESFRDKVSEIIGPDFDLLFSTDGLENYTGPLNAYAKLSKMVFWLSSFIAVIILTLSIQLSVRSRRPEMGIYLSLGEERNRLCFQVMYEVGVAALPALIPALITGQLLASGLSNTLLNGLTADPVDGYSFLYTIGNLPVAEVRALYKITVTPGILAFYIGVGLGTVTAAVLLSLIYLHRLNPKEILLEEQT